jgi:hypothetical protein
MTTTQETEPRSATTTSLAPGKLDLSEELRTFLENLENIVSGMASKLDDTSGKVDAILSRAIPKIESLDRAFIALSDDYKTLADASKHQVNVTGRLASNVEIMAASARELAEHVGILMGHSSRLDGRLNVLDSTSRAVASRVDGLESTQRATAEATDKELAALRVVLAEDRKNIIELTKRDPEFSTPDEITAVSKYPPVLTALERQLAQLSVEKVKDDLEDERKQREDDRRRQAQMTATRATVLRYVGRAVGLMILALAMYLAGRLGVGP